MEDTFHILGIEQVHVPLLDDWLKNYHYAKKLYHSDYYSWELESEKVNWDEIEKMAEGTEPLKSSDADIVGNHTFQFPSSNLFRPKVEFKISWFS